jgi:hypothetical protein
MLLQLSTVPQRVGFVPFVHLQLVSGEDLGTGIALADIGDEQNRKNFRANVDLVGLRTSYR